MVWTQQKQNEYLKTYNKKPEVKVKLAKYMRKYRKTPKCIKREQKYNKTLEVKSRKTNWRNNNLEISHVVERNWRINNPDKILEKDIRRYEKYSDCINMTVKQCRWMLRSWSVAVRKKDDNMCIYCGSIKKLHAHHILPKKYYPELMFVLNNGVTVCEEQHLDIHRGLI
jgi:5-methylcytosine-specific restriction endonuclease McrA